jgi:hypothetical protein
MTVKQFSISILLGMMVCLAIVGIIMQAQVLPAPSPSPASPTSPRTVPPPTRQAVDIASQKARLQLTDGRTATFWFATSGGSLQCTAAVGLDQVLCYLLTPAGQPSPTPDPPSPGPGPTPPPTPQAASNLRVLLLYDPARLIDMPAPQQAILAAPELRSFLDQHCPLESGCAEGICRMTASKTASYRFLPVGEDLSRLPAVWQQTYRAATGKPPPWLLATNETGQVVIDQAWPATVQDTLALLKKAAGE